MSGLYLLSLSSLTPSTRARPAVASATSSAPPLLIVGAGVLGKLIAEEWRGLHGPDVAIRGARELHTKMNVQNVQTVAKGFSKCPEASAAFSS